MTRVLLIANTLPPRDLSGAGEQVMQLAAGLEAAGHEVQVLGRGEGGARGPKVLFPLTVVPAAWRALRRSRPEVVQVHESDGALAALLVRILRPFSRPRPKLVALLQVSYREEIRAVRPLVFDGRVLGRPGSVEKRFLWTKAPIQLALGILTARLADRVLACSRRTADEIERDYGVRDVGVLPNVTGGLPVAEATAHDDDPEPGYLLYIGRLRVRKGVEVLLDALPNVAAAVPGTRLVIAGDGEQRTALEAMTADLGLESRVRFLGRCDAGRVRGLMRNAACLVVPSIYEGMPLVILEAMSEGIAVVASAVSGIPEVVIDGETGWLVPPVDPPALSAALTEALENGDETRRRGLAGKRRLEAEYTPTHAARRWRESVAPQT